MDTADSPDKSPLTKPPQRRKPPPARQPETVFNCRGSDKALFSYFTVTAIGIDIGSHSIKTVEVRRTVNGARLIAARIVDVYPDGPPPEPAEAAAGDAAEDGVLETTVKPAWEDYPEQYTEALKMALGDFDLSKVRIVTSLSGGNVMVRQVELPILDNRKLNSVISWESKRYLPFEAEEMIFSSSILREKKSSGKMDVLLVAARKEVMSSYIRLLKSAGIEPDVVDASPLAQIHVLKNSLDLSDDEPVALLDIGAALSTLCLFSSSGPVFSRTFNISGETFTNTLKNRLNISYAEAEIIKRSDAAVFDSVKDSLDRLISKMHQTFIYYGSLGRRRMPKRMFVAGGSAFLPKMINYMATELDMEVSVSNPMTSIKLSKTLSAQENKINLIAPQMAHSIGLALR